MTQQVEIRRPNRWDKPYDSDMATIEVERILRAPAFREIKREDFPPSLALLDIIKNDTRILRCPPRRAIVRAGDYGTSLFVLLAGTARVLDGSGTNPAGHEKLMGEEERTRRRKPPGSNIWRRSGNRARSQPASPEAGTNDARRNALLTAGDIFGVSSALTRTPYSDDVVAETGVVLADLRWQGLRDLRRWSREFRKLTDDIYRSRQLKSHLREVPCLKRLSEEDLENLAQVTLLECHGTHDWASQYKQSVSADFATTEESEPPIVRPADYLDGLIIIRTGFARITEAAGQGERTVGFAGKNELFGLDDIIEYGQQNQGLRYRYGLRALGYVDLLRIPTDYVERLILPSISVQASNVQSLTTKPPGPRRTKKERRHSLDEAVLNFLINSRTINGSAVMFIDMDRCTGCDDCVRACAATHGGEPKFVRHGPSQGNLMVASACMHCTDPVCMVGCPTGAIHRSSDGGLIRINESTCIGCAICADSCPYNNIRMAEMRDDKGRVLIDEQNRTPILKATKCDLCHQQATGPACQRACPHDALVRLDAQERTGLADWLDR